MSTCQQIILDTCCRSGLTEAALAFVDACHKDHNISADIINELPAVKRADKSNGIYVNIACGRPVAGKVSQSTSMAMVHIGVVYSLLSKLWKRLWQHNVCPLLSTTAFTCC